MLKTNQPFPSLAITAIPALWAFFHIPLLPSQNLSHNFISGCSHDCLTQNYLILGFELLHSIQQRSYLYPVSPSQTSTPLMNETSVTRMDETGRENCQTHRSSSRALFFHWLPANRNTAQFWLQLLTDLLPYPPPLFPSHSNAGFVPGSSTAKIWAALCCCLMKYNWDKQNSTSVTHPAVRRTVHNIIK